MPPHKWDDLPKASRQADPKLENRLEQTLEWWDNSGHFNNGRRYPETPDKRKNDRIVPGSTTYRFAARVLHSAGYSLLQIDRGEAGERRVADRFGGLVDPATHKRSFAIEPAFSEHRMTGSDQKAARAAEAQHGKVVYTGKTFPDLVVQRGGRKIAMELKVPFLSGNNMPISALQANMGDHFHGEEFTRRKERMGPEYDQRLLVDVNSSGLSMDAALAHFRSEHGKGGTERFKFDSLQFIHHQQGKVALSEVFHPLDGFAEGKREGTVNPQKSGRSMANFFGASAPKKAAQPVATHQPDTSSSSSSHKRLAVDITPAAAPGRSSSPVSSPSMAVGRRDRSRSRSPSPERKDESSKRNRAESESAAAAAAPVVPSPVVPPKMHPFFNRKK